MKCKFCKEDIIEGAIKCKHCGSMLDDISQVGVQTTQQESYAKIPKLWNPVTIAWLSFLSLTAVGPYLQAKNWKELNNPEMEKSSKKWFYASIVVAVISLIIAFVSSAQEDSPIFKLSYGFYFVWYFISSNNQIKFIKKNNIQYDKKSLLIPMIVVVFINIGIIMAYVVPSYNDYKIRTNGGTYHTNSEVSKIIESSMTEFLSKHDLTKNTNVSVIGVSVVKVKGNTYKGTVSLNYNNTNGYVINVDIECNYRECGWEAISTNFPPLQE